MMKSECFHEGVCNNFPTSERPRAYCDHGEGVELIIQAGYIPTLAQLTRSFLWPVA